MNDFNETVTVTLTRLEARALKAAVALMSTEDDVEAARREYGDEVAEAVEASDACYKAYTKIGDALRGYSY